MKPRQKRLVFALFALIGIGAAAVLINTALRSNLSYYFSPSQVNANEAPKNEVFRVGGLVKEGSLKRQQDGLTVQFLVTDNAADVKVSYTGILPDLFKEGQGMVARGKLGNDGIFYAEEVLAKHDENYMPPEVASSLKTAHEEGVANAAKAVVQ